MPDRLTRTIIAIAGIGVAVYSVASGDWWGLAAVVVVLAAIFAWRPSWLRVASGEPELPALERAVRLEELARWRRLLVPAAAAAVVVQGWALHRLLTTGEQLGTSVLATLVATLLTGWAVVTHVRIERLGG